MSSMSDGSKAAAPSATRGPWRIHAMATAFENPWIRVDAHDVTNPAGEPGHYGVVSFKNLAIGILPIFEDGSVVLVGQYRFPLDAYSWELPEGGGAIDVDPMASGQRELREETGLSAGSWRKILDMHLSNSITDERAICYLATDLEEGEADPEPDEVLDIKRVSFRTLLEDVISGRITDSLTVAMALRAHHMAVEDELPERLATAMLRKR